MPRAKSVVPGRAKRRKVLKAAKGNYSGRRKLYKTALQTEQRAGRFAFIHRRTKKRDFRRLWITRINAAAREFGLSYSKIISGLKKAEIEIDRKMLADLAVNQPAAFASIAKQAKDALEKAEKAAKAA